MLSSPFQQPSRRQNALALQIQEARTAGDEALLSRLISQWVHRYGFNGAADLDLSLPMPVVQEEIALEGEVLLEDVLLEDEVFVEEEKEIAPDDQVLVQDEVVVEEKTIVEEDEIAAEETVLQRSFQVAPVPAPPISTPRSLRRWLPRRADDAFPKAS